MVRFIGGIEPRSERQRYKLRIQIILELKIKGLPFSDNPLS